MQPETHPRERRPAHGRKTRVFVTQELVGDGLDRLAREVDPEVWDQDKPPPAGALQEQSRLSDGLLTTIADRITADLIASSPKLRIVSQLATGHDNVDLTAATKHGVLVTTTPTSQEGLYVSNS